MRPSKTRLPNGKWWVREPRRPDGSRPGLGTFATEAGADAFVDQWEFVVATEERKPHTVKSFSIFGQRVLDEREKDGVRGIQQERNRFKTHLATASFAHLEPKEVTSGMIARWLRELARKAVQGPSAKTRPRKVGRATIQRCLSLASSIFDEAIDAELIAVNPCVGLKIKKRAADESATKDKWDYLRLEEQIAVARCEAIPLADRLAIRFAVGTGLRQGEQFNLLLQDVHVDGDDPQIIVRFGSNGKPPKNGKIRYVPLFGDALAATKEWLAHLPMWLTDADGRQHKNRRALLFPTKTGRLRQKGKPLTRGWDTFVKHLLAAGIKRPLRWHDLRHTCASSLVAGRWGHRWTLQEVRDLLGHSSIIVTERYAHLGVTGLKSAARATQAAFTHASTESTPSQFHSQED